jgi:hypothetical protein
VSTVDDEERLGGRSVDADVNCAITRFGLSSPRHLLPTMRDYREVLRSAKEPGSFGLLRSAFLIESPTSCVSFSLWSGAPMFSAHVPRHVDAARRVFGRLKLDPERGPELWSTQWRLTSVSNNLNWGDLDLRPLIGD